MGTGKDLRRLRKSVTRTRGVNSQKATSSDPVVSNSNFIVEDSGSNSSSSSSSNQSDSGVECSSGSSTASRGNLVETRTNFSDQNNSGQSSGIQLRSHRILKDPSFVPSSPTFSSSMKGLGNNTNRAEVSSSSHRSDNFHLDPRKPGTGNPANSTSTRRLRMTFRMKRSNILDEVIESGIKCRGEGERAFLEQIPTSLEDLDHSTVFEPHYEILRCEASSPTLSSNSHSPIRTCNPHPIEHHDITPPRKKSKKKSKKRKHKDKGKDKDREKEVQLSSPCFHRDEENLRLAQIPSGQEDDDDNNNEKIKVEFDLDLNLDLNLPPDPKTLTTSPTLSRTSSTSSTTTGSSSSNPKTKRLKLIIGNEACTIIDIPPTAFQGDPVN